MLSSLASLLPKLQTSFTSCSHHPLVLLLLNLWIVINYYLDLIISMLVSYQLPFLSIGGINIYYISKITKLFLLIYTASYRTLDNLYRGLNL